MRRTAIMLAGFVILLTLGAQAQENKIILRNPKRIAQKRISIVNTGRAEAEDLVQLFYGYSSGGGNPRH